MTGASGYIATWVVKRLLEEGYKVRGTVRSLANEKKVAPLKNLCPEAKYPLELVEADLTQSVSWEKYETVLAHKPYQFNINITLNVPYA